MRLLHSIIPTEKYLYSCKIVESPLCTFCRQGNETIKHLLYRCEIVKRFWKALVSLVHEKCQHAHTLRPEESLVLFGVSERQVSDKGLDMIIMWAKFFIYKSKIKKTIPTIHAFHPFMKCRWTSDKYASIMNNTLPKFNRIWTPYLLMLD